MRTVALGVTSSSAVTGSIVAQKEYTSCVEASRAFPLRRFLSLSASQPLMLSQLRVSSHVARPSVIAIG
jgi:hypothetical protein